MKLEKATWQCPCKFYFIAARPPGNDAHCRGASREIVPGERICLSVIYLGKVDCDNARAAPSNGIEIARVLTDDRDRCHIQQMAAAAKCQVGQQLRFC